MCTPLRLPHLHLILPTQLHLPQHLHLPQKLLICRHQDGECIWYNRYTEQTGEDVRGGRGGGGRGEGEGGEGGDVCFVGEVEECRAGEEGDGWAGLSTAVT